MVLLSLILILKQGQNLTMFLIFFLYSICFASSSESEQYLRWVETLDVVAHPEPNYRYYSEFSAQIAEKIKEKPGVISAFRAGRTVENRSIWGFRVHNPMHTPRYKILIFAGLHPLEWVGTEATVDALLELVDHPPKYTEVVFIPLFNVDRRYVVQKDLIRGNRKYRRSNAGGEDLNREFEIHREPVSPFRYLFPNRYTVSTSPLSQPESQALDRLAKTENFDASISLHSFGGYIYYPWAGRYKRTPDWKEFHELALIMKQAQPNPRPYRVKQLSHWYFMFQVQGTELDHLYGKYGIRSFLIETTRSGVPLWNLKERKDPFRLYNPKDPSLDTLRGKASILALIRYYDQRLDNDQ